MSGTHFRVLFSDFSSVDSFSVLSFPGTLLFRRPCALDSRRTIFDGAFKTGGPPSFTSEVRSKYDCLIQGSTDTFQTVIVSLETELGNIINLETRLIISILTWKHQYAHGNVDIKLETSILTSKYNKELVNITMNLETSELDSKLIRVSKL